MTTHLVKRGVVAVATALCLLLRAASPASANTVGVELTGGTLTAAGSPIPLSLPCEPGDPGYPNCPPPSYPCAEKADYLVATFSGSATSGTWSMTGSTWSRLYQLPGSPTWYQADYQMLSATGNYNGTAPNYTLTGTIVLRLKISRIPPCDKTVQVCDVKMALALVAGSTYTGGPLPTAVTSDAANIDAASVYPHMSVSSCSAPFTAWHGQPATVTSLGLRVL